MENKKQKRDTFSKRDIEYNVYNNSKCPDDYKENMKITAFRINEERIRNKISQKELAKKVDISTGSMSKYNNGIEKVPYHITKRLAKVFGCSVDYLNAKSNVRTEDTNIKQICNNIPLSEEFTKYVLTWERISNLLKYENMRWILNDIDLYIQHKFKLEKVSKSEVSNNTKIETNEFYKELGIISAITILLKQDMENLLEEIKNDEDNIYSNY